MAIGGIIVGSEILRSRERRIIVPRRSNSAQLHRSWRAICRSLLAPKLAVLPMQAVELHPLTARLTVSAYCDDELSALDCHA
jgi:hypothetical protein